MNSTSFTTYRYSKAGTFRAGLGALLSIGVISWLAQFGPQSWIMLVGSFGASAVIVFAVPTSPMAHPIPLILGNLIGASVGYLVATYAPVDAWALPAVAVSLAIVMMIATASTHAPGGAAALIATTSPDALSAGWLFIPAVGVGALILMVVALVVHNAPGAGRVAYPVRES